MSEAGTDSGGDRVAGREYGRVAFAVVCVCAVVLTAALVPALATGSGAPAASLVPLPPGAAENAESETGTAPGSAGGFGALNAGDSQQVGGIGGGGNAFRSQSAETHFTVRSEEPAYWRTGAYDTYTGSGWERSAPSDTSLLAPGETLRYEVDLAQPASSPPMVWRPESLTGPAELGLTGGRRASVDGSLSAGTTYSGVSERPPSDPALLTASGHDYPASVANRYTALPSETRAALDPVTDGVVENASGAYETAVAVERWLETTKTYSLNVSEPGDDVATRFVRQMDAGYCEYFATAMVAMLRTQEIPARYVVGYSTGERVATDTYRVRALNAHAWVEVYFEGVGWVRFDPTPGEERVTQERQALQEQGVAGAYDPPSSGSPEERTDTDRGTATATPSTGTTAEQTPEPGTPTAETPTPEIPTGETPTVPPTGPTSPQSPEDGYRLSLNRTAVPGATAAVSVTAGGAPVADADVQVDGQPVGATGPDGTVVTTLPYAASVTVSASDGETAGASRTYEMPTNATISVSGDRRTGATVTLVATVADVTVGNAPVRLDGERVGRTDDRGRAQVRLPSTPGNVTVRVERGAVVGTRTVAVDVVSVAVDPALGFPVAWTPTEVTALVNGEPEPGATVALGGEQVGETGIDGTVTAWLPAAAEVDVAVTTRGQTVRTTVSNPLFNLGAVVVLVLGIVVGAATALSRYGVGLRDLPETVATGLHRGVRALVRAVLWLAVVAERALEMAAARARLTTAHLRALAAGDRTAASLAAALGAWLGSVSGRVAAAVPVTRSVTGIRRGASDRPVDGDATGGEAERSVREGWDRFLDHVSVDRPAVHTPGQLAAHAIAVDGLPREAVTTLRDEFRAVEYGPRSADVAAPGVASAVAAIESEAARNDGDGDGGGNGDGDATEGGR